MSEHAPVLDAAHGPQDSYGHEWGVQIAVYIAPENVAAYVEHGVLVAAGERGRLGPGCYRCKMTFKEVADRACPGERPKEIDRMRSVGESHLYGLDRDTRRLTKRRDRKAALRRGEDPDADRPEPDPRDVERDKTREQAERDAKARTRNRNQITALERELAQIRHKTTRLAGRAREAGRTGERARRDLEAHARRYGRLTVDLVDVEAVVGLACEALTAFTVRLSDEEGRDGSS